jgi:putative transposase
MFRGVFSIKNGDTEWAEKIFLEEFETVPRLLSGLKEYFKFYNFERAHQSLEGKTPAEIYCGREVARKVA